MKEDPKSNMTGVSLEEEGLLDTEAPRATSREMSGIVGRPQKLGEQGGGPPRSLWKEQDPADTLVSDF